MLRPPPSLVAVFALVLCLTLSLPSVPHAVPHAHGQSYKAEQDLKRAKELFDEEKYDQAFRWYRKAAKKEHSGAQTTLGSLYYHGKGVKKNHKKAVEWYRKAANKGNPKAQTELAQMYYEGEGVKQDYKKAAEWTLKAAEQGYARAQYNIGVLFFKGEGVEQHYKKAVEWYRKAAEQGNLGAQGNLAKMYEKGDGVEKDCAQATHWWNEMIRKKGEANAEFLYNLAERSEQEAACPDPQRAAELLGAAAAKGYAAAKEKLETLAKQDDIKAQYMLAKVYANTKDYTQAAEWYRKAAEQGDADALFRLGILYEEGKGVEQNKKKFLDFLLKAAKKGSREAQSRVGLRLKLRYERETGDLRDYKEAARWYRKAAEQGEYAALWQLGLIYDKGEIVKKDKVLAGALLLMSYARGNEFAAFKLQSLQEELTTEQKNKVDKTVKEWEERIKANRKK